MATTMTTTTTITIAEGVTVLDQGFEARIARFNEVKAMIKALDSEKDLIDAEIRAALGDNEVGVINGVERVRIAHRVNSKIDRDALKTGWPEAFEATLVQTPYTVIQAK